MIPKFKIDIKVSIIGTKNSKLNKSSLILGTRIRVILILVPILLNFSSIS